jgi:ABC-type Fe3+ transport system permease subunit
MNPKARQCRRTLTVARILIPIMTPALMAVLILAVINGLQDFEMEMILGAPMG